MESGDPQSLVTAWHLTLEDVPYNAAENALRDWCKQKRWPPDPSELRQMILVQLDEVPDGIDAWKQVVGHMKSNGMVGGKPFAGPPIIKQTVEAIGGWYTLRMSTDPNGDREAFLKAYATYSQRSMAEVNIAELVTSRLAAISSGSDEDGEEW